MLEKWHDCWLHVDCYIWTRRSRESWLVETEELERRAARNIPYRQQ